MKNDTAENLRNAGSDTIPAEAYCAAVPEGSDLCGFINGVLSELKENGELERLIKMYN